MNRPRRPRSLASCRPRAAALLAALAAPAALNAQTNAEACLDVVSIEERPGFYDAYAKIHSGEEEAAIAAFEELRSTYPEDPDLYILDYNLGCALARLGRTQEALAVLRRAVDGGYGRFGQQNLVLQTDPDLEGLRTTEGWAELSRHASDALRRWPQELRESQQPFLYVPPPLPPREDGSTPTERLPLLLVLHDHGTEQTRFAQQFLAFAKEHRFVLLSVAGPMVLSPEHFTWFDSSPAYVDLFRDRTQLLWLAVQKVKVEHPIDPERIYVTGLGQGGALAFALAARNPQWVRGGIVCSGALPPAALYGWVKPGIHWGRRIRVLHAEEDTVFSADRVERYVAKCQALGFAWDFARYPGPHGLPADLGERLAAAISWIDEVPFPHDPPSQAVMLEADDPPVLEDPGDGASGGDHER